MPFASIGGMASTIVGLLLFCGNFSNVHNFVRAVFCQVSNFVGSICRCDRRSGADSNNGPCDWLGDRGNRCADSGIVSIL